MRLFRQIIIYCYITVWPTLALAICPSLDRFYVDGVPDWAEVLPSLDELFDECLESSEFFSLYGSAQLNTGNLADALESLERALLLDSNNGAALIDYAEALLVDGQLFAALEANELLIARDDTPENIREQIVQRGREWFRLTRQSSWQIDGSGGYDNNLNGAPSAESIPLTLSGEAILLALNDEYKAVEGPLIAARVSGSYRWITPEIQHSVVGQLRGRLSDDRDSDVLQLAGRYMQLGNSGPKSNQMGLGINHLVFRGNALFTGSDASFRRQLEPVGKCRPYLAGAGQYQRWHQQRRLDGVEIKLGVGSSCFLENLWSSQLVVESSVLRNQSIYESRLGGDREGWQINSEWRVNILGGSGLIRLSYANILDERGFSPLLADNSRRYIDRGSVLLQYRKPVGWLIPGANMTLNLFHQEQRSNIKLFEIGDTSVEIGLSWIF